MLGMWKWIFGFAMVDMSLGGGYKYTERPSKSAYLRELGLILKKIWKLLKNFTWARRKVDFKMGKFRQNPDLSQDLSGSEEDLGWDLKKNEQKWKKKLCTSFLEHESFLELAI